MECWHEHCKEDGMLMETLHIFCGLYNFICRYIEFPLNRFNSSGNTSWDALIEKVRDGYFDTTVPLLSATQKRSEIIDFSEAVYDLPLLLVFRMPPPIKLSFNRLMALDWKVWLCITACAAIVGIILTFAEIRKAGKKFFVRSFLSFLDTLAILTNQSQEMNLFRTSTRILLLFWAVSALVVSGVYSGTLLKFLLENKLDYPFTDLNSFLVCLEKQQCQLALNSASSSHTALLFNSTKENNERIQKILQKNPPIISESYTILASQVASTLDKYVVWLTTEPTLYRVRNQSWDCNFTSIKTGVTDLFRFPVQKNSSLKNILDSFAFRLKTSGLNLRFYNRYNANKKPCKQEQKVDEESRTPLPIVSMYNLLFILLVGYVLSTFILIYEKFIQFRAK